MTSIRTQSAPWCLVADGTSVEARFGVRACGPNAEGGNQCAYVFPPWSIDSSGRPRVGALMVLADHILGELPYLRRPASTWSLTTQLTLDIIEPETTCSTLLARADEFVRNGRFCFVHCRIEEPGGKLVAVGTTRTAYVAATGQEPDVIASAVASEYIDSPSVEQLLGIEYEEERDALTAVMHGTSSWVNGFGIMHGGVSSCVAEIAAARLVSVQAPHLVTAHVHTDYVSPVVAGAPFVASARMRHAGRGSAVVEVLGHGGDGRLCTVTTVSAAKRPDGPREEST